MKKLGFVWLVGVILWGCGAEKKEPKTAIKADSTQNKTQSLPKMTSIDSIVAHKPVTAVLVDSEALKSEDINGDVSTSIDTNTIFIGENIPVPSISDKTNDISSSNPINPNISTTTPKSIKSEMIAQPAGGDEKQENNPILSHAAFDQLLKRHVTEDGRVNYIGFGKDRTQLEAYLNILARNPIQENWERNKKLAYWINVYNAFTIKKVIDRYPIVSLKDENNTAWRDKNIRLGNEYYSLDQIENEIIRPQFKEPRIHFALNVAAKSCPKLLNEAYMPDKLESQLHKQTQSFVNNTIQNTITDKKVEISKVFEWYANDFVNVINFLNQYLDVKIKENTKLYYKEYNWSLNE